MSENLNKNKYINGSPQTPIWEAKPHEAKSKNL